jgi:IS66 C-terminal element
LVPSPPRIAITDQRSGQGNARGTGDQPETETARGDRPMHTIIEAGKVKGFDPDAYLRALIARVADHPAMRISELLPWNIKL